MMHMLSLGSFLAGMEGIEKVFWIIALTASLVFIIQTIITFIGLGTDADIDAGPGSMDGLGDSMEDGSMSGLFSFRNLVNFLLGYGWGGALLYDSIGSKWLLQLVALCVGFIFVAAFVLMFRQLMRLSHDGSFKLEETVGMSADVYLRIPASRTSRGKIQISVKGSVHEIDAVTDRDTIINTGDVVRVVKVLGDDLVLVE